MSWHPPFTLTSTRTHSRSGAQDLNMRPGRLCPETQTTRSFIHQEPLRRVVRGQGRIQMRSPRDWPPSPSPVSFHLHLRPGLACRDQLGPSTWPGRRCLACPCSRPNRSPWLTSKRTQHTVEYPHVPPLQGSTAPTIMLAVPHAASELVFTPACRPWRGVSAIAM